MLLTQRGEASRRVVVNPPAKTVRCKPLTSGFAEFVTERSPVHTSWRGFTTITHLLAPNPTLPLVTRLALCSRPGAALLNVVASILKSRETRLAVHPGGPSGY